MAVVINEPDEPGEPPEAPATSTGDAGSPGAGSGLTPHDLHEAVRHLEARRARVRAE